MCKIERERDKERKSEKEIKREREQEGKREREREREREKEREGMVIRGIRLGFFPTGQQRIICIKLANVEISFPTVWEHANICQICREKKYFKNKILLKKHSPHLSKIYCAF